MVLVGLGAMFESGRGSPPAGDLSVVACDAKLDTSAEMLAGTYANLPVPVVLAQTSGAGDSSHGGDRGSSANATCPGIDAVGAVESGRETVGSASRILVHANSCSGNSVEISAPSAPCG